MKILMIGRGVISSLYGWAFEKAGHQVEFYVRPGRAAEYGPVLGLELLDARGNPKGSYVDESFKALCREDLPTDHDYDLIVVSVRHDKFRTVAEFLGHRTANATVLIFNSFWGDPLETAAPIPRDRLAWGFPAAGGGFDEQGVLQGALLPQVHFGTFGTEPTLRELAVRNLFREAGFQTEDHRDFRGWLWLHFAVSAGMDAQGLRAGSSRDLAGSPVHLREAILNVRELLSVVVARGIDLKPFAGEVAPYRFPAWLGGWVLQNSIRTNEPFRLILELYDNNEEAKLICRDVLAEARKLQVPVPRLEAREEYFRE